LDLWIKNENPVDNVKKIQWAFPDKPIIIFTSEDSEEWKGKMLKVSVATYSKKIKCVRVHQF